MPRGLAIELHESGCAPLARFATGSRWDRSPTASFPSTRARDATQIDREYGSPVEFASAGLKDLGRVPFFDGSDREIRRVRSVRYGDLWAPEDFAQLGVILDFIASQVDAVAWRGQADIRWPLDCGAIRRLLRAHLDAAPPYPTDDVTTRVDGRRVELGAVLEEYERSLLDEARLAGHDRLAGRRLSDFEVLATLQHHGAATRFLDFTRNLFVALWFASTPFDENWGIVLGVRRMTDGPADVTGPDVEELSASAVANKYSGRLVIWRPAPLVPRIAAQQSVLICSPVGDNPWGSFGIPVATPASEAHLVLPGRLGTVGKDLIAFAMPPELKHALRQGSQEILGYDTGSMFPDLDGFCRWQAATAPLDPDMYRRLGGL